MKNLNLSNDLITIHNAPNGKDIADSNFWTSPMALKGLYLFSVSGGCIRVQIPDCLADQIPDMVKGAKHIVISVLRGITQEMHANAFEFLIEDGSDSPWVLNTGAGGLLTVPAEADKHRAWTASIWGRKNGKIHKFMERRAYVRYVETLPCPRPYDPAVD